jgi:hypothetical protein
MLCSFANTEISRALSLFPAVPETSGLREKAVLLTDLLMCFQECSAADSCWLLVVSLIA